MASITQGLEAAGSAAVSAVSVATTTNSTVPGKADLVEAEFAWLADGPAADVYTHIARGLTRCHLGYGKDLAKSHIMFAEMPSGARQATVIIHERTPEDRHGLKSFVVNVVESTDSTRVAVENLRFDLARQRQLSVGIKNWSKGRERCEPLTLAEIKGPPGQQPPPVKRPATKQP